MSVVKRTMKPAFMSAVGILVVILVTSEVVALLVIAEPFETLTSTPIPEPVPVNLVCPSNQTQNPDDVVGPSSLQLNPLGGGIYETLRYDILLKKAPGIPNDSCVLPPPEPLPRMPILHPQLRLIPVSRAKQ